MVQGTGDDRTVDGRHPGLTPVADVDEAQGGQGAEGFAHDRAADPQLLGEIGFGRQRVADAQLLGADVVLDRVDRGAH